MTFYYAMSMVDKYVYANLSELLEARKKNIVLEDNSRYIEMEGNYQKLVSTKGESNLQMVSVKPIFVGSTDMYKASQIIKRFQHIADKSILRGWHNGVLTYYKTKSKNQLIDFSATFSLEEINEKYKIGD